jgi:hypothetical protein
VSRGRTWTDLLKDETGEALFRYYGTSELLMVDVTQPGGAATTIGPPRMYTE